MASMISRVASASLAKAYAGVRLNAATRRIERITAALDALEGKSVPQWLEVDREQLAGNIKQLPVREDITLPIEEQLIVELYSR